MEQEHGIELECVGINHRTAPLEVRESMWFSAEEMTGALRAVRRAVR